MANYMYSGSGDVDTKGYWLEACDPEFLEEKGWTAEQAFSDALYKILIPVKRKRIPVGDRKKGGPDWEWVEAN